MRCTPRRVLSALIWAFVLVSFHLFIRELTEPSSSSSSSSANRDDQQFDPDNPPLYIGLDMSTQSLKVTVLSAVPAEDRPGELVEVSVVRTASLNFDEDLPRFMTHGGVHRNGTTVTSPPLMWVTALDVLLGRVGAEDSTVDLSRVVALSASGQQHGSVFWSIGASDALGSLDPSRSLAEQLQSAFGVHDSPVWMDSSTSVQCLDRETRTEGGAQGLSRLTGSRAYERFTGNQIAKLAATETAGAPTLQRVERISLVSSFVVSLFAGEYAGIDSSDAGGMNLMDIHSRRWDANQLAISSHDVPLAKLLGDEPIDPRSLVGPVAQYFVSRYNFSPDCVVVAASGDNPCSLAGLGLSQPGDLAISLGTSDTLFFVTDRPRAGLEGHIFVNPVDPESYFGMAVFKNGGVVRERLRDAYCESFGKMQQQEQQPTSSSNKTLDRWEMFAAALEQTRPGNMDDAGRVQIGIYVDDPEITPPIARTGEYRFTVVEDELQSINAAFKDPRAELRAAVESRFLSMRLHATKLGLVRPTAVVATGGASASSAILQVMADVFAVDIFVEEQTDSASFGAGLRAVHAERCYRSGPQMLPFSDVIGPSAFRRRLAASPDPAASKLYGERMLRHYEQAEQQVVKLAQ